MLVESFRHVRPATARPRSPRTLHHTRAASGGPMTASSVHAPPRAVVDERRATIILAAMALSTFLFVTVESLPSGLLTLMAPDLGRSTSEIGLLVTGYALMARLALGNSLAPVLGVPAGTWLGEHSSWRWTFAAVAGLSLVVTLVVAALFPTIPPAAGGASRAPHPSARRFGFQMATTALVVTSAFGIMTFVTQFLIDVAG